MQRDRLSHLACARESRTTSTAVTAGGTRGSLSQCPYAGHLAQCHCTRGVTLPGVIEKKRRSIDVGTRTALSAGK
jgi:hypothetical protein